MFKMLPRRAKRLLATQSRALAWHGGVPIVVSGWDVGRWQGVHRPRYLVLCVPPGAAATLSGLGMYRLGPFPRHSLQGRKRYPFWYGGVPFLVWECTAGGFFPCPAVTRSGVGVYVVWGSRGMGYGGAPPVVWGWTAIPHVVSGCTT